MPDPDDNESEDAKVIPIHDRQEAVSVPGGKMRRCEHMATIGFGYFACGICGPLEPDDG